MKDSQKARVAREVVVDGVKKIHGVTFDGSRVWFAHGDDGEVISVDPATGKRASSLRVPADAGVAFDGEHLWIAADTTLRRVDRETGEILSEIQSPAGADTTGLAYHDGHLWVGSYKGKTLFKVDAKTGEVKKKIQSNRLVTGVTFRGAELWHGAVDSADAVRTELRRLDDRSGDVLETRAMPDGIFVSGTEADASGRIWCGDPEKGTLRLAEW